MVKVGDGCNISYHDMTWYVATCRNLRVLNSSGQFPWNIGTCMQKTLLLFRVLNNCYILNKYDLTDLTRFNALTQISVVMRFHSKWWCSTAVSNFQLNGPGVFLVDLWTISFIACQAAKICEVQNLVVFSTWPMCTSATGACFLNTQALLHHAKLTMAPLWRAPSEKVVPAWQNLSKQTCRLRRRKRLTSFRCNA